MPNPLPPSGFHDGRITGRELRIKNSCEELSEKGIADLKGMKRIAQIISCFAEN
jgi:hypothetical protein